MRLGMFLQGMIILMLAGCGSQPVTPVSNEMLRFGDGMAKLVVYYPYSSIWSDVPANVGVAGTQGCRLKSGTFFIQDVPAGEQEVSAALCNGTGTARLPLHLQAGQKYYIQIMPNDPSVLGIIAGYGVSVTAGSAHAQSTIFYIDLVDEQIAAKQLNSLKINSR